MWKSIDGANTLTTISEDKKIIFDCKESFLYNSGTPWVEKEELAMTMGSYDGAETTDLFGLFLLHQLSSNTSLLTS